MNDTTEKTTLEELTEPCDPSTAPDYLAFKKAKIKKGLEQSKDRSKLIPAHKVWEDFGFER